MNRIYYLFIFYLLTFTSCSKEENLKPTGANDDYFSISPEATDAESVLRRNFYEINKVHLLFNDTLHHEQQGTYADGTPIWFTKILDLEYTFTSGSYGIIQFEYLKTMEEKESASTFVTSKILSRLDKSLRPYSIFLVNTLKELKWGVIWEETNRYNGMRCLAIATGKINSMTENEENAFCLDIFYTILNAKFSKVEDQILADFYSFGDKYYGKYYKDFGMSSIPVAKDLHSLGFILTYSSIFPDKNKDLESYMQAIFYQEEEEFKAKYANYPIILQKYDILKRIIEEQGFKF